VIHMHKYVVCEMRRMLVFSPPVDSVTNLWIDGERIEIRRSGEGSLVGLHLTLEDGRTVAREIREAAAR
jgi:hypothetical protein